MWKTIMNSPNGKKRTKCLWWHLPVKKYNWCYELKWDTLSYWYVVNNLITCYFEDEIIEWTLPQSSVITDPFSISTRVISPSWPTFHSKYRTIKPKSNWASCIPKDIPWQIHLSFPNDNIYKCCNITSTIPLSITCINTLYKGLLLIYKGLMHVTDMGCCSCTKGWGI